MENQDDVRFWPRVGMYVSREFAEEWIEKVATGDEKGSRFLDDEIEEFTTTGVQSPRRMRAEVEALFDAPFEEGELDIEIQAILKAEEMTRNRKQRIKELRAEGHELEDAKAIWTDEMNTVIAEMLGIEKGEQMTYMGAKPEDGEDEMEAPPDGGTSE